MRLPANGSRFEKRGFLGWWLTLVLLAVAIATSSCGAGLVGAGAGAGGLARMGQVNSLWDECVNSWGYTPSECDYAIAGLPIAQPMPAEVPQPTYPPSPAFSCRMIGNAMFCD